jgi:hypothetical protein
MARGEIPSSDLARRLIAKPRRLAANPLRFREVSVIPCKFRIHHLILRVTQSPRLDRRAILLVSQSSKDRPPMGDGGKAHHGNDPHAES